MSTLPNVSGVSGTRSITPPRNDFKGRSNNKMSSFSSTGTSSNISTSNRGTSSKFNKSNTTTKSYYNAKKERMSSVISDDDENDDNLPLPVSPENLVYIKDNQLAWIPAIRISSIETEDTAGSSTTADSIRVKVKNYNIVDEQSITLYNFLQEIKKQDFMNTTTLDNWKEMDVKLDQYPGKLLPIQSMFPKGTTSYTDMVEFEHLHEAGILYNLKARHIEQKPYTRCGDMIVSINPFQWLRKLYSEESRAFYSNQLVWKNCDSDPRRGLEPHVYEVSALAYKGLAFDHNDQSILITGESGSGKTETAKIIMNHIASIQRGPVAEIKSKTTNSKSNNITNESNNETTATSSSSQAQTTSEGSGLPSDFQFFSPIVQRILESNPLLEAFGNAKTRRNDNSSRFGKYTQLQFDKGDPALRELNLRTKAICVLAGSKCEVYLLEKNRVCTHAIGERTYHIFYQLLSAEDKLKDFIWKGIIGKSCEDFKYVGPTKTKKIDGVTDEAKYLETIHALADIGVDGDNFISLMRAICIVLQLGNITFDVHEADDDRAIITSEAEFNSLSELMGISVDDLTNALTERTMLTRGETFKVKLKASASKEACDALAKEIYSKTFLWLVRKINDATCAEMNYVDNDGLPINVHGEFGVIGLLDIFGFESFEHNHFEQLCINYANEKIQQKAVNDIFRATKQEYDFQGIPLSEIEFDDNQKVLNLIEGKMGLVNLLNDECYRPKGSDEIFLQNVLATHASSPCLVPPKKGVRGKFGIVHFAGIVEYEVENFVQSNQASLPLDLSDCQKKCSNNIISNSTDGNTRAQNAQQPDMNENPVSPKVTTKVISASAMMNYSKTPTKTMGKDLQNFLKSGALAGSMKVAPLTPKSAPLTPKAPARRKSLGEKLAPLSPSVKSSNATKSRQIMKSAPTAPTENAPSIRRTLSSDAAEESSKATDLSDLMIPSIDTDPTTEQPQEVSENEIKQSSGKKKKTIRRVIKVAEKRPPPPKRSASSGLLQATVWTEYQQQLSFLMDMLSETKSRYVRCIKPNTLKKPNLMEHVTTTEQLRCSGIVATVCLARALFPNSLSNGVLRFRYQNLWEKQMKPRSDDIGSKTPEEKLKLECAAVLNSAFKSYTKGNINHPQKAPFVIGKSRTYFRKGAYEYLESILVVELETSIVAIQGRIRGILVRSHIAAIRRSTPRIQRWYRAMKAQRKLRNLVRKNRFQKARNMFKSPSPKFVVTGSAFR